MAVELIPPDPPLRGDGLFLRCWTTDDVPFVVDACQDELIQRFIPVPVPYAVNDAERFIEVAAETWASGTHAPFAIVDAPEYGANSDDVCGAITVHTRAKHYFSIGYWIAAPARGHGLATKALQLVSRWAFANYPIARLELAMTPDNIGSIRVAEKAGFVREGLLRARLRFHDRALDVWSYSLLRGELAEQRVDADAAITS